ncbi:CCA tRNA nucleotidyltransferase [Chelativorans sp. ZYF759]|uniref:CCA tRNA nucleotidyltransferase n=1 Tax=Chelativorans sp. ZYF759 TaxID=2692213 RepID=UPI00145F7A7E|nr:CCA tRNA nucleotidyltransferase [Chelativorans sp. ZYF759]NMG40181.1 CCA tRNA nucleotidyltransferase [Chelativorans sp. ZYF759]
MSLRPSIKGKAEWLEDEVLQRLLAALSADGEEARIAGGAVRNALICEPVADIDIATTNLPDETVARAEAAGFRTVPTGKEHGTITVVAKHQPFEVTTLRDDIETDGRHAKVAFGKDWKRDAERRDFTFNALYARADGTVVDLVGGLKDLEERRVRFIGDAEARIREDYLRILRFFRFFATYGAGRPDAEGLKACAKLKEGMSRLSAERVWAEIRRLLGARDPSRALLWMRTTSVLSTILPETEKWGIDTIHPLVGAETDLGWSPDSLLRLTAIVPPDPARLQAMADRLRLSKADAARVASWAKAPAIEPDTDERAMARLLYRHGREGIEDRLRLSLATARGKALTETSELYRAGGFSRLLGLAEKWKKPQMPIRGADLIEAGSIQGPELGSLLARLEDEWIDSNFALDRDALLARAAVLKT